jgi:hypothetical protein
LLTTSIRANAEEKEALRKLLNGPSFAGMGKAVEVTEAAIKFENLDGFGQVGKTASGTVGEISKVEVTPITGGTNPSKPLVVENEAEPGLKWTALGETSNSFYRSAGKDYKSRALVHRLISGRHTVGCKRAVRSSRADVGQRLNTVSTGSLILSMVSCLNTGGKTHFILVSRRTRRIQSCQRP